MTMLSVKEFVRLAFVYKQAALIAFAVTLGAVVIGVFILPSRYVSEAKLLIKPGRESTLSVDIIDRPTVVSSNAQRDLITDEKAILSSNPVVTQVAEALQRHLDERAKHGGWTTRIKNTLKQIAKSVMEVGSDALVVLGLSDDVDPRDQMASKLERNFTVASTTGSAVIDLKFEWDDSAVAKVILSEWVNAYLRARIESMSGRDSYGFYEKQLAHWQELLAAQAAELEQLHQTIGAVNLDERERKLRERIQILETQSDALKLEESALKASIATAKSLMPSMPDLAVSERVSKESEAVSNLRVRLNDALVLRETLLRTYEPSAPPVLDVDQTIANLRRMLASEPKQTLANETLKASTLKESVARRVTDKRIRMEEITATSRQSIAELLELRKELATVINGALRQDHLKRELKRAEENVVLYSSKLEKVRIDQELDLSRISNVSVIEPPTLNTKRVFPKTGTILMAAPFAALVVALLLIFLLKITDTRIFDGWRIQERFGIPFLGLIPEPDISEVGSDDLLAVRKVALCKLAIQISSLSSQDVRSVGLVPLHENDDCVAMLVELQKILGFLPGAPKLELTPSIGLLKNGLTHLKELDRVVLIGISGYTTAPALEHEVGFLDGSFPGRLYGILLHGRSPVIPKKLNMWLAQK